MNLDLGNLGPIVIVNKECINFRSIIENSLLNKFHSIKQSQGHVLLWNCAWKNTFIRNPHITAIIWKILLPSANLIAIIYTVRNQNHPQSIGSVSANVVQNVLTPVSKKPKHATWMSVLCPHQRNARWKILNLLSHPLDLS